MHFIEANGPLSYENMYRFVIYIAISLDIITRNEAGTEGMEFFTELETLLGGYAQSSSTLLIINE